MLAPDGSSVSVDEFELTLFFEGLKFWLLTSRFCFGFDGWMVRGQVGKCVVL